MQIEGEKEVSIRKSDMDKPQIHIGDLGVSLKCIELKESGFYVRSATT